MVLLFYSLGDSCDCCNVLIACGGQTTAQTFKVSPLSDIMNCYHVRKE